MRVPVIKNESLCKTMVPVLDGRFQNQETSQASVSYVWGGQSVLDVNTLALAEAEFQSDVSGTYWFRESDVMIANHTKPERCGERFSGQLEEYGPVSITLTTL